MSNNELTMALDSMESIQMDIFNDNYDYVMQSDLDESEHYELEGEE